ncbi:MAG: hypothetical protein O2909_10545 [Chloroflexi bacterium]|nr:hypothetical protein [Chloroflexota bacterium]
MTTSRLAPVYEIADPLDAMEECYRRGWTDGLPVVPPTEERVSAMLDYMGLARQQILGEVPVRRRVLTAEQAAANTVMAGCLPEYFPVVLAVLDVLFQYDPNCIHEVFAVTNSPGILILLNGPIRQQLGVNCTDNLFTYASRANTTIGRAVRLILLNVFEQRPGILDRGCMGSLTKNGVVIGEDEENSPWPAFHVSRGFGPEESTVTVATIQDPAMMGNRYGRTGESLMESTADAMASHGLGIYFNSGPQWFWIVGHWHAEMLGRQGWDRPRIQKYVWDRAWRSRAHLKRLGMVNGEVTPEDESTPVHAALGPEDIHIVKAGGNSGIYSELMMNYYGVLATTVRIPDAPGKA